MIKTKLKTKVFATFALGVFLLLLIPLVQESIFASIGNDIIVTGTMNVVPFSPEMISLVASDPDGGDAVYGNDDVISVTFDKTTNRPAAATKADLENLFTFSQNLGNDFTGSWASASVLEITIVDATGATPPTVGGLTLTVQTSGNLRNEAGTSFPSTSLSPVLSGDFGDRAGPGITSLVAADPGDPDAIYDDGDTITVRFTENTNTPAVNTKAALDLIFDYSQGGPASLGTNYAGVFTNERTLVITVSDTTGATPPAVGGLTLTIKTGGNLRNEDNTSLNSVAVSPPLGGTFGIEPGPFITSLVAEDPDGGDAVFGVDDTITVTFSESTNQPFGPVLIKSNLDTLFSFSQDLGVDFTGLWVDPVTLVITIQDPFGAAPPTIGGLQLTVRAAGNLRDQANESLPSTASSSVITGNFGTRPGPSITSLVVADPDGADAIFGDDDVFTVTFDEATNRPSVATRADLDSVFILSQGLGTNYVGTWSSPSVLTITVLDSSGGAPTIGGLTFTVKASTNLKNDVGTSLASTSLSPALTGSFGDRAGPSFTSLIAADPDNDDAIFDAGDTITARFIEDTNQPPVANKNQLDDLFTFSQEIGDNYNAVWLNPRTLEIRILDATVDTPPQVGGLQLIVKASGNLRNAGSTSLASTAVSPFLDGTFGTAPGPSFVSVVADDPDGGDAVFGAGDTITVTFDEATNEVFGPILTKANLDTLFTFSQDLGTDYTGLWSDPVTLVITIVNPLGSTPPTADTDGVDNGELRLTVNSGGGLKDAANESLPSIAISPLLTGNFGTKPGPSIVSILAADPNGGDAIFNDVDTITVTFDEGTNRPIAATKINLDALFSFSQSLGTNYVGSWTSPSVLEITIVDDALATPPVVGQLTLTVQAVGNLKNVGSTSLASTSVSSALTGSFGDKAGPGIASLEGQDPSNDDAVFDTGDTLTVRFTEDTNQIFGPSLTRAELDSLFSFSQSIGDDYSGTYTNAITLVVTIDDATVDTPPVVGELQFTVKESAGLRDSAGTSLDSDAVSPFLIGTFGTAAGPSVILLEAQDPFGSDAVFGNDDTITVGFDVPTNEPFGPDLTMANVDSLLTFSDSLGTDYTASWFDSQTLIITIVDSTGATPPAIGAFSLTVNESANLKDEAQTSLASISASPLLGGDFGTKPGPSIVSVIADDTKSTPVVGLDNDDTITVEFDEATNQPPVSTKAELDDLFVEITDVGADYTGVWFDPLTLVITIDDATGGAAVIGSFTLTIKDDGTNDLNNSANTSLDSTAVSPVLDGNFGQKAGPSILSLIADDPKSTPVPGFDNGDTITVIWSERTTLVNPFTRAELDSFFTFSQSIGDDYTGVLTETGDLVITIVDGQQLIEPPVVDELQLIVKENANIQADGGSLPSTVVSPFLAGNFGAFVEEIPICDEGQSFSTFPDGKTAQISYAGPVDGCGGYIFETADQTTSERIEFVGDPVSITPIGDIDCAIAPNCDLAFVFREDQIPLEDGVPVDPFTAIKIMKDVNADQDILQDFDNDGTVTQADLDASNEVFNGLPLGGIIINAVPFDTPDTIVIALDDVRFEASTNTPSNSKFAIGGIKALALAGLGPTISTPPSAPSPAPTGAGAAGGGGGGGNAASIEEGFGGAIDLTQVKLYEATWDKCDEKMLRVIAGPVGPGLSVKAVAAMGGIIAMKEAAEQPFTRATVYETAISELETFIRVQVEGVIGREASLAQRSLDLRECAGSIGGYSESEDFAAPPVGVLVGSFPSTAALFEDGLMFETRYNDLDFGVGYWMPEGEITEMNVDEDAKAITFSLSEEMGGKFILSLPRGMISADDDQFVLIHPETSEPIEYDILESGVQFVTLEMTLPEGTNSVTVVGTSVVPEFGGIAILVLVITIVSILVITRTRQFEISRL